MLCGSLGCPGAGDQCSFLYIPLSEGPLHARTAESRAVYQLSSSHAKWPLSGLPQTMLEIKWHWGAVYNLARMGVSCFPAFWLFPPLPPQPPTRLLLQMPHLLQACVKGPMFSSDLGKGRGGMDAIFLSGSRMPCMGSCRRGEWQSPVWAAQTPPLTIKSEGQMCG